MRPYFFICLDVMRKTTPLYDRWMSLVSIEALLSVFKFKYIYDTPLKSLIFVVVREYSILNLILSLLVFLIIKIVRSYDIRAFNY